LTETYSGGTLSGLAMNQNDNLGQVISGRRYWQDGTEVAGQQFEYRFDDTMGTGTTTPG
jgi:hypothetical protein